MPDFWLDTDSFIGPMRGPYSFDIAPGFWITLAQKASEDVIASSTIVYNEIHNGADDELLEWAKQQKDSGLFIEPDSLVQSAFRKIADYVEINYEQHNVSHFLDGADPWIIAHAKAYGGRVVTFEKRAPQSRKPKIPDICDVFGVNSLNIYELLKELNISIG